MTEGAPARRWRVLRRYFAFIAAGNLLWEIAQVPLYTIAWTGSWGEVAYVLIHCTAGDILIAAAALFPSLWLIGGRGWPQSKYLPVAIAAVVLGVAYTVFSEWLNVDVRQTWAYTELMPRLPPIGTGLTPVLQWMIIPPLAFAWARR